MRLRPLTEAECYHRCYPGGDETVRVLEVEPRRARYRLKVTGEDLRRGFERRLDSREPEAA